MFIWDFVAAKVLGQIVDWFYSQIVGFLGNFFAEMGNMGAELFTMDWVQSIVLFFSYLAWALYGTGLVVACFETGVEYSSGRGNIRETALNAIKGFMAVSLFTVVPVRLYELCVSLQGTFTAALTGYRPGRSSYLCRKAKFRKEVPIWIRTSIITASSFCCASFGKAAASAKRSCGGWRHGSPRTAARTL